MSTDPRAVPEPDPDLYAAWLGSRLWRHGRARTGRELRNLAERAGLVVIDMRGAIYYPRWRIAACLMRPWDAMLGRLTTFGAAFIALSAVKPRDDGGHAPGSLAR